PPVLRPDPSGQGVRGGDRCSPARRRAAHDRGGHPGPGYFERLVEPRLDGEQVSYVGPVGPERRGDLLGGARALLHLVNFDEPFGFSVVEAMACGTPVIARRRGSMAEIVRHAENGLLVETLDEVVAAVHAAKAPDR